LLKKDAGTFSAISGNKISEILVRRFGDEPQKCPNCGSSNLEKLIILDAHFYRGVKGLPKNLKIDP
jgi:hypothetical protein